MNVPGLSRAVLCGDSGIQVSLSCDCSKLKGPRVLSLQLQEWVKRNTTGVCVGKFRVRSLHGTSHFNFYFAWQSEDQKIRNQSEDSNAITTCMGAGNVVCSGRKVNKALVSLSSLCWRYRAARLRGGTRKGRTARKLATLKHFFFLLDYLCKYLYLSNFL